MTGAAAEANGQGSEAERGKGEEAGGVPGGGDEAEEAKQGGGEEEGERAGGGGGEKGAKVFENVTVVEDDDSKPWEHHHYASRIEQVLSLWFIESQDKTNFMPQPRTLLNAARTEQVLRMEIGAKP